MFFLFKLKIVNINLHSLKYMKTDKHKENEENAGIGDKIENKSD